MDRPHYEKVGSTSRADGRTEVIFARGSYLQQQWDDASGLDGLEFFLQDYYRSHPEDLELDLYRMKEISIQL
jgi:hypothetical protein